MVNRRKNQWQMRRIQIFDEDAIASNSITNRTVRSGRRDVINFYFYFRLLKLCVKSLVAHILFDSFNFIGVVGLTIMPNRMIELPSLFAHYNSIVCLLHCFWFDDRHLILDFMHSLDAAFHSNRSQSFHAEINRNVNRNPNIDSHDSKPPDQSTDHWSGEQSVNEIISHTRHKIHRWPRTLPIFRFSISLSFIRTRKTPKKGSNQKKICRNLFEFDMAFYLTCLASAKIRMRARKRNRQRYSTERKA